MTTLQLFLYILLAVFAQLTLAALLAIYRHLRSYKNLQDRMAGLETDPPAETPFKDMLPQVTVGKVSVGKVGPWRDFREFKVERRVYEDADRNICSFYLKPTDQAPLPAFKPGQFLTFNLDVVDPASGQSKTITRCYSLSDGPGHPYYRVSIKRVPPPPGQPDLPAGVSSNHFHDNVHEGDLLQVRAPSGHFFLPPGNSPVVLIGGGIGITPMLSMLGATLNAGSAREIWLFYGLRNSADHGMKAHLEDLALKHENFRLHVCYGAALDHDKEGIDYQHEGFVDLSLLRQQLKFQIYDFYICGPRPMMENLVPALEDWGVPDQHIHYEAFGPASITRSSRKDPVDTDAAPVTVTFSKSGKTLTWDGSADTLLDFAEQNGISVESGCRAGGCGMCQTKIESGEVAYIQAPDFDAEPGTCLMCVARPKHDLTLEA